MNISFIQELLSSRLFRKRLILVALIILIFIPIYFVYNHGYIVINISDAANNDIAYNLLNQQDNKSTSKTTPNKSIRKFLKRGQYEVAVRQDNKTYFAVAKIGGFFSSSTLQGSLKSENSRTFVGEQPHGCMHYTGQVLISYDCSTDLLDVVLHQPATANSPTLAYTNPDAIGALIEGIAKTPEGTLVLLQKKQQSEDYPAVNMISNLSPDLTVSNDVELPDLDISKLYTIKAYAQGFAIYDPDFSEIFYYASKSAKPTKIGTKVTNKGFSSYTGNVSNGGVVVAYTDYKKLPNKKRQSADQQASKDYGTTKLSISQDNKQSLLTFKKQFDYVTICSTNKLCTLSNKTLEVYSFSKDKYKLQFSINDVDKFDTTKDSQILAVRGKSIVSVDVNKQSGFSSYNMDSAYTNCGLVTDSTGYTLCLKDIKQKPVALHVDYESTTGNDIDKKIAKLLKYAEIDTVSVYDRFIYIVPDVGPLIYNETSEGDEPDPVVIKRVNAKINQAISDVGIDTLTYTIYNPYAQ